MIHCVFKIRESARFTAQIHNPCAFYGQICQSENLFTPLTKGRKGNEIYFFPVIWVFKTSEKNRSAICICACLASGRLVKNWQSKGKGRVFIGNGIFWYFYGQSAHFICLFGFGLLGILSATFLLL